MRLIAFLFGAIALPAVAAAAPVVSDYERAAPRSYASDGLPGVFGGQPLEAPVILAQSGDPRVGQLEEQVRQLTGRIEELNFQILQMQEGLRKMQEDVDFRLQDLEQKRGDATGSSRPRSTADATPSAPTAPQPTAPAAPPSGQIAAAPSPSAPPAQGPGAPERPLGALVIDGQGNVTGGTIDLAPPADGAPDGDSVVAALPPTDDPGEVYRNAYEFILSGDYGTAETGFRDYIARFPDDAQAADAHYWLGEALLGQQRYRDAAEVFVSTSQTYPDSRKAPETLLKLGVALAALNQREVACATFAKVGQRYPQASATVKERVKQERALVGC